VQPEKEIERRLAKLTIEAKEVRKRYAIYFLIIVVLTGFVTYGAYYSPKKYYLAFSIPAAFLWVFGIGMFVLFVCIPTLIQPLKAEKLAFKKIAEAAQTLEKLGDASALPQASRDVKSAYNVLSVVSQSSNLWYKQVNDIINRFLQTFRQVILPAIEDPNIDYNMKIAHLQHIALAIYSFDPAKLVEANRIIDTEPSYGKFRTVVSKIGIRYQILQFFSSLDALKQYVAIPYVAIPSFLVGSIIFYEIVIYFSFERDTALDVSVAVFLGLLAIWVGGRKKPKKENETK